jgi:hypothetical protein
MGTVSLLEGFFATLMTKKFQFESAEIAMLKQYVPLGCQIIAEFINCSTSALTWRQILPIPLVDDC